MNALKRWLDERTGYQSILRSLLYERIPGGSRWRYVFGSTLVFAFMVQVITGIFLAMTYSPSTQTAWASVYYVQHVMAGGWLLRGIHHFCAQLMILLLGIHLLQVVWDGAYKAPREVNFWFGLILLHLALATSLTGYLLPWDQKGFWATKVATNIFGVAPVFGPYIQKLLVGGTEYGHHTLTRFFTLHAGVLPLFMMLLIAGHIYLFRRHGLKAKEPLKRPEETFWPNQVLKDAAACLVVLSVILALILRSRILGVDGPLGAELGAPADPAERFSAARPEWYFLFMFQFLKYFPGETEIWGAIIIPNIILVLLLLMPFVAHWRWGHKINLAFLASLAGGIVLLTSQAIQQDRKDPEYKLAVEDARRQAQRAVVLAQSPAGIPAGGGLAMMQADPLTMGPRLFSRNCAVCHRFDGHDGTGRKLEEAPSASDLKHFGSREWLTGFLDPKQISEPHYFGGTKFKNSKMARFVKLKIAKYSDADKENLTKVMAAVSAEAGLKSQKEADARDAALIQEGRELFKGRMGCADCHKITGIPSEGAAPDLSGWGSREWLAGIMHNPAHARFYGESNDRMPAFGAQQTLDEASIGVIADWLRREWHEPAQSSLPAVNARATSGPKPK